MLNFIYGALTMWFTLGAIIYYFVEHTKVQPANWSTGFLIVITAPFFVTLMPIFLFIEVYKEIKETIQFNWNHEWKWKFEEIKEKIKYRY